MGSRSAARPGLPIHRRRPALKQILDFQPDPAAIASACAEPLPPFVRRGVELFNEGEYFEAHEVLEEAWRQERRPVRELYRVILQAAVACYKLKTGNYNGFMKMVARLRTWAAPFPGTCQGIQLAKLLANIDRLEAQVIAHGPENISSMNFTALAHVELLEEQ